MENKSMNIYRKLMRVRVEFHKLELKKSGYNKFSEYKYYELSDFLVQATQLLEKEGLCPIITFDNEFAIMTVYDCDNVDQTIVLTSPMRSLKLKGTNEIQNLGGIQTYLTRYLYTQLLNVVESDAFDATSGKSEANENLEKVYNLANGKGYTKEQVNAHINKKGFSITNFTNEAFETMYNGYLNMQKA